MLLSIYKLLQPLCFSTMQTLSKLDIQYNLVQPFPSASWRKFHFRLWLSAISVSAKIMVTKIDFWQLILISCPYLSSRTRDLDLSRLADQASISASSLWLSLWKFRARCERNSFPHSLQVYSPIFDLEKWAEKFGKCTRGQFNPAPYRWSWRPHYLCSLPDWFTSMENSNLHVDNFLRRHIFADVGLKALFPENFTVSMKPFRFFFKSCVSWYPFYFSHNRSTMLVGVELCTFFIDELYFLVRLGRG